MTIPNVITLLRFFLGPGVVFALLSGRMEWALAGFVIAGVSDGVDGFIARQFNQRSVLGAYLDPMADKLLLVSVFVVLGLMGNLPLWLVIAAVSRDALIIGLSRRLAEAYERLWRKHQIGLMTTRPPASPWRRSGVSSASGWSPSR